MRFRKKMYWDTIKIPEYYPEEISLEPLADNSIYSNNNGFGTNIAQ